MESQQLEFQKEILALKENFYKDSMATPATLEQELLIAEILREDLYDIADYLDNYIDTGNFIIPQTNVINLYNKYQKKITDDVVKYSKQKQILINQFMEDLREILIAYNDIDGFLKQYYINQIFRIHVFNLGNVLPGEEYDEGI